MIIIIIIIIIKEKEKMEKRQSKNMFFFFFYWDVFTGLLKWSLYTNETARKKKTQYKIRKKCLPKNQFFYTQES